MNLVTPEIRQMPSAYTDAQIETHARQQALRQIPGFVLAKAGFTHEEVCDKFTAIVSASDWKGPWQDGPIVHAVGYPDEEALDKAMTLHHLEDEKEMIALSERGWHLDGSLLYSNPVVTLHVGLEGSVRVEAVVVSEGFTPKNEKLGTHDRADMTSTFDRWSEALQTLKRDCKIDTDVLEPVIWHADVSVGQAVSLTIDGLKQAVHNYTSTTTPRLSAVYDFNPPEIPAIRS